MYRHYSKPKDAGISHSQVNRNRIKNVLILLLLAALGVMAFFSLPALREKGETRSLHIQRIQAECDEAVRQTSTLSRSAGADSASILARIRSNLHAIRIVNELSISAGNGALLPDDNLLSFQDSVDRYLTYLTTGMDTGEYQTNLQNQLGELQAQIAALE